MKHTRQSILSSGSGFPAVRAECWRNPTRNERRLSHAFLAALSVVLWLVMLGAILLAAVGCSRLRVESATGCGAVSMVDGDRRVIVTHCEGIASECVSCGGDDCTTCADAERVDWGSVVRIVAAAVMSAAK